LVSASHRTRAGLPLAPHPRIDGTRIGCLARPHDVAEDELGFLALERDEQLTDGGSAAGTSHGYAAVTRGATMSDVTGVWLFVVIFFALVVGLFLFIARR
jgi:hypothetical protein